MLIKRLYRQHTAVVLSVPKPVLEALEIKAGDYIVIDINEADREATIAKLARKRYRDGESQENKHSQNLGG
ncbi:MAG TPA: hypothetical protein VMY06_03240 [Sedimentisphaerales bacterium]|nr:hypothetical protein [Sedimentisphaerales bacterium]